MAALALALLLVAHVAADNSVFSAASNDRARVIELEIPVLKHGQYVGVLQHLAGQEPTYTARLFCAQHERMECDEDHILELAHMIEHKRLEFREKYKVPFGAAEVDLADMLRGMIDEVKTDAATVTRNVAAMHEAVATLTAQVEAQTRLIAAITQFLGVSATGAPTAGNPFAAANTQFQSLRAAAQGGSRPTAAPSHTDSLPMRTAEWADDTDDNDELSLADTTGSIADTVSADAGFDMASGLDDYQEPVLDCGAHGRAQYMSGVAGIAESTYRRTSCSVYDSHLPEIARAVGEHNELRPWIRHVPTLKALPKLWVDLNMTSTGAVLGPFDAAAVNDILTAWPGKLLIAQGGLASPMQLSTMMAKLQPFEGRYELLRRAPLDVVTEVPDASLQWIVMDLRPSYAACRRMLTAWSAKLVAGGILAGGQWMSTDCADAVQEFAAAFQTRIYITDDHASWFVRLCW